MRVLGVFPCETKGEGIRRGERHKRRHAKHSVVVFSPLLLTPSPYGFWIQRSCVCSLPRERARAPQSLGRSLVDPASSHMLVSKIKPCMSKSKLCLHGETADGSLNQSWSKWASPFYLDNCGNSRANTCNSYPDGSSLLRLSLEVHRPEGCFY